MKIAALFHVSFEKLGLIEDWILTKGYSLIEYHLYNDPRLPLIHEFDMLIIMGGSMSVNDEERFPWLTSEKELIKRCREFEKPVLGICLGAQLIASALGNSVFPGKHTEIGWFPVEFSQGEEVRKHFPALPVKTTVFHWHGDTFDLPGGAVLLGSSAVTPVQAYLAYGKLLALQFHLVLSQPLSLPLQFYFAGCLHPWARSQ